MTQQITGSASNYWVNVKDHGAVGNGVIDDTAAIQAAIDYALANIIRVVFFPAGIYIIRRTLYMDPPNSLRASSSVSAYSLCLQGVPTGPSHENAGGSTIFVDSGYNFPAVIVGPGRSQSIRNMIFNTNAWTKPRGARNPAFYAVALAAFASQFMMSECRMENYYGGVKTGFNGNDLTDSNTFFKCFFENLHTGLHIGGHQNYINTMIDCTCSQVKISVLSDLGKAVNVLGGNFSLYNNYRGAFTISSVSAFTGSNNASYRLTAVVSSPDAYFASGDYDLFCVYHSNWGPIPLRKTAYNSGTSTITLKIEPEWLYELMGSNNNVKTTTTLEADIKSCKTLYCAEAVTTFYGTGIHAYGVHIENPLAVTTVLEHTSGFNGDECSTLENIFLDWDQTGGSYAGASGADLGLWYLQQVTPLIRGYGGKITLRNWVGGSTAVSNESSVFTADTCEYLVENCYPTIINPELWVNINVPEFTGYYQYLNRRGTGFGRWDRNYNRSSVGNAVSQNYFITVDGQAPNLGLFPAPYITPRLAPYMLKAYVAGGYAAGALPAICGQSIYQVLQWDTGAPAKLWAKAAHKGYSWGANIPVNWSYVAGSRCLHLDNTSLFFPGLVISLNSNEYVVKSLHKLLGYVTVMPLSDTANEKGVFKGTIGSRFSGTSVGQAAITFTTY